VRRADRLFRLVQQLRRRRVSTAAQLAEALGVSARTIYRDVRDLSVSGVPVVGEAGVGYALARGFDVPPLMFTAAELEALVLGARVVRAWADPELKAAAEEALGKIEAVLPERLKSAIPDATLFAPDFHVRHALTRHLATLRKAIRESRKVRLAYEDRESRPTARTVRPLGLFFWGGAWSLGAWCELRSGFRNFRLDRMSEAEVLAATFRPEAGKTLADLFRHYEAE
jgi:predicted DNA-binding transcriptional regulator YafY